MEKNELNKLKKKELIEMINQYEEKLRINEECNQIIRIGSV